MKSVLKVSNYSIAVHLGCSELERKKTQEVLISLRLEFSSLPKACKTDSIFDTTDYDNLCKRVAITVEAREFNTIEYLGQVLYDALCEAVAKGTKLHLTLHKVKPPIPNLKGGTFFEIG